MVCSSSIFINTEFTVFPTLHGISVRGHTDVNNSPSYVQR